MVNRLIQVLAVLVAIVGAFLVGVAIEGGKGGQASQERGEIVVRVEGRTKQDDLDMVVLGKGGARSLHHISSMGLGHRGSVWDSTSGTYSDTIRYYWASIYSTKDPSYRAQYERAKTTEEKIDALREWIEGGK